jgi:alanine racemase
MRDARVVLNSNALRHNLAVVRDFAPHAQVLAMVKADAYGHGLAFAISSLQGADALGVAFMQEALDIRALGNTQPIVLIEGVFSAAEWRQAAQINASCAIHQDCQLQWALDYPIPNTTIWLKVNTGMNRLGLAPTAALEAAHLLRSAGYTLILTTHFANADEPNHPLNRQQIDSFLALKQQLDPIAATLCNSAALIQWPELHFDWVRPGIMLYGSSPFADRNAAQLNLQPVMTFSSQLIARHTLPTGVSVGYGSLHTTARPTELGVVAIGYGDGYPRVVSGGIVLIAGQRVPIIGRVSMDMLTVDLTDLVEIPALNSRVILWGAGLDVDEIAATAGTIGYELFTRLSPRPKRQAAQDDEVIL